MKKSGFQSVLCWIHLSRSCRTVVIESHAMTSEIGLAQNWQQLCSACADGDVRCVRDLLIRTPNLANFNHDSRRPLLVAVQHGHLDVVKVLLPLTDVNVQDSDGYSALQKAAAVGFVDIVRTLLQSGAMADSQDLVNGNSALHEASWRGYSESVELLIKSGANTRLLNKNGFTSLHLAAQNGHNQTARVLLSGGCDMHVKNNYGDTALHTAARYGHAGVLRILLSAKCRLNERNKNDDTALHIACALRRRKITELLLKANAECNILNKQNETPLDIARRKEYPDVAGLINKRLLHGKPPAFGEPGKTNAASGRQYPAKAHNERFISEKPKTGLSRLKEFLGFGGANRRRQKASMAAVAAPQPAANGRVLNGERRGRRGHPHDLCSTTLSDTEESSRASVRKTDGRLAMQRHQTDGPLIGETAMASPPSNSPLTYGLFDHYQKSTGTQYYRDLAGNVHQGPAGFQPVVQLGAERGSKPAPAPAPAPAPPPAAGNMLDEDCSPRSSANSGEQRQMYADLLRARHLINEKLNQFEATRGRRTATAQKTGLPPNEQRWLDAKMIQFERMYGQPAVAPQTGGSRFLVRTRSDESLSVSEYKMKHKVLPVRNAADDDLTGQPVFEPGCGYTYNSRTDLHKYPGPLPFYDQPQYGAPNGMVKSVSQQQVPYGGRYPSVGGGMGRLPSSTMNVIGSRNALNQQHLNGAVCAHGNPERVCSLCNPPPVLARLQTQPVAETGATGLPSMAPSAMAPSTTAASVATNLRNEGRPVGGAAVASGANTRIFRYGRAPVSGYAARLGTVDGSSNVPYRSSLFSAREIAYRQHLDNMRRVTSLDFEAPAPVPPPFVPSTSIGNGVVSGLYGPTDPARSAPMRSYQPMANYYPIEQIQPMTAVQPANGRASVDATQLLASRYNGLTHTSAAPQSAFVQPSSVQPPSVQPSSAQPLPAQPLKTDVGNRVQSQHRPFRTATYYRPAQPLYEHALKSSQNGVGVAAGCSRVGANPATVGNDGVVSSTLGAPFKAEMIRSQRFEVTASTSAGYRAAGSLRISDKDLLDELRLKATTAAPERLSNADSGFAGGTGAGGNGSSSPNHSSPFNSNGSTQSGTGAPAQLTTGLSLAGLVSETPDRQTSHPFAATYGALRTAATDV